MIRGQIMTEIGSVENIHIINKNTFIATISDTNGNFQLPVKENDTLFFSAIQFEPKLVVVTKNHLENLKLKVTLKLKINTLEEAIITQPKNMAKGLGLPNAGKKPLTKIESNLNYHTKSSLPVAILAALLNKKGGIEDIIYITSGRRKKDRRLQKMIADEQLEKIQVKDIQNIRLHFKDTFFTETLKIPTSEIAYFIKYCDKNDVIYLFKKNRYLEVIDLFIKESTPYLEQLKNEE